MWKVDIVSHDNIKPTSATPQHLNTHNLSWLDRMSPPVPVSIVLFYPDVADAETKLPILKKSLSETLTLFYPLAGRLNPKDASIVDCNDEGIDLFVARAVADAPLSQLLDHDIAQDDLSDFLPLNGSKTTPLLSLQVTVFPACSGMTIGVCILHTLADGHSIAKFIATWAANACGDCTRVALPAFDATSRFGAQSCDFHGNNTILGAIRGKRMTKRFVFDQPAIDTLRKSPEGRPPTRAVAVFALLWRCCMRARLRASPASEGSTKLASVAVYPVNMREKGGEPLLPDHLFGNLCAFVAVSEVIDGAEVDRGKDKLKSEQKLRNVIEATEAEWISRILGADGRSAIFENLVKAERDVASCEVEHYHFTSWLRFPLYEADFGWGKPVWVAPARLFVKNVVVLMERGAAGGIEAWIVLGEYEMAEFERDEELKSYACAVYN